MHTYFQHNVKNKQIYCMCGRKWISITLKFTSYLFVRNIMSEPSLS